MILSIIIINYNTFDVTCQCINSIYKIVNSCHFEIIIVDNASTECSPDLFKEKFSDIILVKSEKNLGFAGGNNFGLNHAIGDIILLLNSDTILTEDCITPCVKAITRNDVIGVITPKLLNPDLSYQKNARRDKSIQRELLDLLRPIIKLFPYKAYSSFFLNQYFKGDYDIECDWVCGAYFMTRRKVIDKLPNMKLDDRFFMYGEDALWCHQIKHLGYIIQFISNYSLVHIGNVSTNQEKANQLNQIIAEREVENYRLRGNNSFKVLFFKKIIQLKSFLANIN